MGRLCCAWLTDQRFTMKMIEEEISADTQSRDPEKTSRDLFGVQLEVTGLLLEAERRRLVLLQAELAVTSQNRTSFSRKQLEQRQLLDSISSSFNSDTIILSMAFNTRNAMLEVQI
ncbi:hypothetical protein FJT64_004714 [Amphibalanus amphitrite]|uniref:Uncharacterized protein n=1 Tax=Amphibalanus amphitrite TaxID=1232801 RepID=A0A6A4VUV2_AMPAM|nr:hypothetical protein FJT64_004714 [Amphibalanus amphitrite]